MKIFIESKEDRKDEEDEDEDANNYIEELLNWHPEHIYNKTKQVLKSLNLSKECEKNLLYKLKNYHHIESTIFLINGTHIKIIYKKYYKDTIERNKDIEPKIQSLIFCKNVDYSRNKIICKGYGKFASFFQLNFDDFIVFQKNTPNEELLCKSAKILFG